MGRLNRQVHPEVTLTLDFGGSGTKGIAQIRGGKPTAIWMEPAVIEATKISLAFQTRNLGNRHLRKRCRDVALLRLYKGSG
jgi:hypothetical protein